jgi:putative aminopeptidase FrvX
MQKLQNSRLKELIRDLSEAIGPPGYEMQVRSLVRKHVEPFVDELRIDNLGNLIARKGQRSTAGQRVMVIAHMDEVGLVVSHIDQRGFGRFVPMGNLSERHLPGSRIRFINGRLGLIGLAKDYPSDKIPSFDQMFIDLGAPGTDEHLVQVGDLAVLDQNFADMGGRWSGKAFDNRIGIALQIEALRLLAENDLCSPHELFFVFSAQEQIGSRGAATATYGIDPDLALVIDMTGSADTPMGLKTTVEIGKGPAIVLRNRRLHADPWIIDWVIHTAQMNDIPYQMEIGERSAMGGSLIQLSRSGVPTGGLSVPARYLHTGSEMVDETDVHSALSLLVELLMQPLGAKNL